MKLRILMVSNIYPSEATPEMGAFVRNCVVHLGKAMPDAEIVLVKKQFHQGRLGTLTSYLAFLASLYARLPGRWDLVYAHMVFPTGFLCLPFALLRRIPLVSYAHGGDVVGANKREMHQWGRPGPFGLYRLVKALTAFTLARSARVHTCSAFLREEAVRLFGIPRERFLVASMGIDTDLFRPAAASADAPRTILYVGRLTWQKGFDLFLGLAEALRRSDPGRYRFLCIGRCHDEEYLARIRSAGDMEHVNGLGQAALPAVYAGAWITVMPSRYEAFGLVAVESLSCGTPVLAADTGGLRDIVKDGENGFLFRDLEGLVARFRDLEREREVIAARCRASVERFDIRKEMALIAADCREAMRRKG